MSGANRSEKMVDDLQEDAVDDLQEDASLTTQVQRRARQGSRRA
jgi:hypothetical protein